ncbi:hypothetical protein N665_0674s0028 [Sinapis alba]|nr:hypothetical protein N665_0674s0028 [Sinapis alba]
MSTKKENYSIPIVVLSQSNEKGRKKRLKAIISRMFLSLLLLTYILSKIPSISKPFLHSPDDFPLRKHHGENQHSRPKMNAKKKKKHKR